MWADPLTTFGNLSIPLLISNSLTLIGFIIATYFALKYTRKFYEGRPMPKSWLLIIIGLIFLIGSEATQFLIPYRIDPVTTILFINSLAITAQDIGIFLIVFGCFFLYREVEG